jgi:hypothetical protein
MAGVHQIWALNLKNVSVADFRIDALTLAGLGKKGITIALLTLKAACGLNHLGSH